ncbi:hypothetical protein ACFOWM_06135 [Ferruginibacter yonginensis]|uniref:Uncharacterized protein n=1 Tax=Ferruginibacter yonginensis TaxID=1310416 RepID=A0ABV8QQ85_9BACT
MAFNRYAAFYAAYNKTLAQGNTLTKQEVVLDFTQNRTKSLQDLEDDELQLLVKHLNQSAGSFYKKPTEPAEVEKDNLRKAIISQFHQMYRTPSNAIAWAEKYGVNGSKKRFNDYDAKELMLLLQNAKKVKEDWQTAISKKTF